MTARFFKGTALALSLALSLPMLAPRPAAAVECAVCEQIDSTPELFEYSAFLGSPTLRHQIRGWLAEHRPDTPGGMAARAWIAGLDGDTQTEDRLYAQALEAVDWMPAAAANHAIDLVDQEKFEAADALLARFGERGDNLAMRYRFWLPYNAGRKDQALAYLADLERTRAEPAWVPVWIRAILAVREGDRAGADQLYDRAMDLADDIDLDLFVDWLNNRRRLETAQGAGSNIRQATYNEAMELAPRVLTPMGWEKLAVYAEEHLNDNNAAFNARVRGIRQLALPELVSGAFFDVANNHPDEAFEVLARGLRDFPYNYDIAMTELEAYTLFRIDPERAAKAAQRGVENVTTQSSIFDVFGYIVQNRARMGDYASIPALMDRVLPRLDGEMRRSTLLIYSDNRLEAGDIPAARAALQEAEALGANAFSVAKRADLLDFYEGLLTKRTNWLASQPFLQDWEARFGDSLRAAIQFETGKAEIKPASFPVIENAADALNAPGGEDYVFLIEGHTDSRGTDEVNFPLSEARAAAVKAFLVTREGLDAARIQTRGFGPQNPLATNATEAGRQENRRVEIRPLGNINDPQVATPGAYDTVSMEVSRDGRIAVMGTLPTQVWDLERNVVLKEIPGGGNHLISPNGRYLATISGLTRPSGETSYSLFIYDLRSGTMVDYVKRNKHFGFMSWSPFSDQLVFQNMEGFIEIYDLAAGDITQVSRLSSNRGTAPVLWTADGTEIVAAQTSGSGPAQVLDAKTLAPLRVLSGTGWIHAMGQSADGRYVVLSDNRSHVQIYDREQGWKQIVDRKIPMIANEIFADPDQPMVVMRAKFDDRAQTLTMDLPNGSVIATSDLKIEGGGFTPDGVFLAGAGDELVRLDPLDMMEIERRPSATAKGQDTHVFDESGLVLASDAQGSAVWSLKTGRRVHVFGGKLSSNWVADPDRPATVYAVADHHQVIAFDSAKFETRVLWQTDREITALNVDGGKLVVATVPADSHDTSVPDPEVWLEVFALGQSEPLRRIKTPIVTAGLRYGEAFDYKASIHFQGGVIALRTAWSDGRGRTIEDSRVMRLYEAGSGNELARIARERGIEGFKLSDDGQEVQIRDAGDFDVYDVAGGKFQRNEPYDPLYRITLDDGRTLRWMWDRITLGDQTLTFPMSLHSVSVSSQNHVIIAQTSTGRVEFIDLESLRRVLTIVPFTNGEWVAYTPSGTYTASLNGTEGVYWSLGDNYLPFEALSAQFSKPNLVADLLAKLTNGTLRDDDVPEPDVKPDTFDAPYKLDPVTPASLRTEADSLMLELRVLKDSADLPDPELRYTLNGREVVASRGFEEEAVFADEETVTFSRRFDLRVGENILKASLIWNGAEVASHEVRATRSGSSPNSAPEVVAAQGGDLWFFGVGVSQYEKSSQNLEFAAKDATTLAALLEDRSLGLFNNVHTRVLTDAEATERDVRVQMNEFLSQSKPEDVVIVFLAGHGVTDDEQNLYFVTHDAELDKPYTGMDVERFRSFLENRPLNQSALLLIDICKSGTAGRVVSEDAVQKLSEGTGAIVFSSASGSGLAYEDESFGGGHGAFTAALLEALEGMADSNTGNRDGMNSLQEMVIYTAAAVPRITEGMQRPTIPMMGQGIDYEISTAN